MTSTEQCCNAAQAETVGGRRAWLKKAGGCAGAAVLMAGIGLRTEDAQAASLTKAQRDALTPDQVIEMMKKGNKRFRAGKLKTHDYLAQKRSSASGQYPAAVILSCIRFACARRDTARHGNRRHLQRARRRQHRQQGLEGQP